MSKGVDTYFGEAARYPERRPMMAVHRASRRWRLWHRLTAIWVATPVVAWLAVLPIALLTESASAALYAAMVATTNLVIVVFSGAVGEFVEQKTVHDHLYENRFWRTVARAESAEEHWSAEERSLLEAIWVLRPTTDRLEAARLRFDNQISESDRKRTAALADRAQQELAHGNVDEARQLLLTKLDAEQHQNWVAEQIARLDNQLVELHDREYQLKARLALFAMREEALAAQVEASSVQAEALAADYIDPLPKLPVARAASNQRNCSGYATRQPTPKRGSALSKSSERNCPRRRSRS